MFLLFIVATSVAAGSAVGYGTQTVYANRRAKQIKTSAQDLIAVAEVSAADIIAESKRTERESKTQIRESEQRLAERQLILDGRSTELDRRQERLRREEQGIDEVKVDLKHLKSRQDEKLQELAALTKTEARERVMKAAEQDLEPDLITLMAKLQTEAIARADDSARMTIAAAMERVAADQTAEHTVTMVTLASDELKGRIIGKEGRNIQSLERATGVDFIIDETPGAIIISSFDPLRREVARMALEKLLVDGRVHPARIEEVVAKCHKELDRQILKAGEAAAKSVSVVGLPQELLKLLGALNYRTSFSQNVLAHSVEMARMADMIAREIGANIRIARTAALLHDIGKAVTHEVEGAHHHIGAEIAERYGMEPAIVHAIKAHHDDVEATTPEALVVRVVDTISASRPGARGNTLENYAQRMTELETIALSFPGIDKAYAVSAGRELRVIVRPEKIDDYGAMKLARKIARKIETTLHYPGIIRVNVIRETRAVEVAK